jgi:hypothetical protein
MGGLVCVQVDAGVAASAAPLPSELFFVTATPAGVSLVAASTGRAVGVTTVADKPIVRQLADVGCPDGEPPCVSVLRVCASLGISHRCLGWHGM